MKKRLFLKIMGVLGFLCLFVTGCSRSSSRDGPEKKVQASMSQRKYKNVYDILENYPGLESFFTSGDLEISEFERRLFGDFLGNDSTADVLVALVDLFPSLIDTGTSSSSYIFSSEVQEEMKGKGPIPDFMSVMGALTRSIVELDAEKLTPYYDYLEQLDQLESGSPDSPETIDYLLEITLKILWVLKTFEKDDINLFMSLAIEDYRECEISLDGKLDFADYDELVEKFTGKAPEGISEILQGLKEIFYDEDIRSAYADFLYSLGDFFGNEQTYANLKALLENLYAQYTEEELGELLFHIWEDGPFIGPEIEKMGIENYGKNGSTGLGTRDYLRNSHVLNEVLETMYAFSREGYDFDQVDWQLIRMTETDPFCFDLKGEGEFGNGDFYQPNPGFSYENFSCLKGLTALLSRWNIPLTFTSNFLFEADGALECKTYIRNMIPEADKTTVMSMVWAEIYEKDDDCYMGNGHPVTEKKGYGIMVDGVYVAPVCPALLTGASLALYSVGDSLTHGPYDNIYDNMRWVLCQRKHYMVIDMVQIIEYVPSLKRILGPMFKIMRIKSLPVVTLTAEGVTSVIHAEFGTVIENLPKAITRSLVQADLPDWVAPWAVAQIKKYMPVGYPEEGTDKVYLLPKDLRDLWTVCLALPYFDSNAFRADWFLENGNPERNTWRYDIREYTYEKNDDVINPIFNLVGALCVAMYNVYNSVVAPYPKTMAGVSLRQEAAMNAFGGIIYPFDYILNILAVTYENTTEFPAYDTADDAVMPLMTFLEPIVGMESVGVIDSMAKLFTVLGKPDLANARIKIGEGISEILGTVQEDSAVPYTFASEILECVEKAVLDPRRWETFKMMLETFQGLLSKKSSHQIVDDLVGLLGHLASVAVSEEDCTLASDAVVEVFKICSNQRIFTRAAIHYTTILDAIDSKQIWADALYSTEEALKTGGMLNYVITGMEKDPAVSWEEVLRDTDGFLHSDLMQNYEEDTFWKDIYYFMDFMAEALE